jgi:hypothetical protein
VLWLGPDFEKLKAARNAGKPFPLHLATIKHLTAADLEKPRQIIGCVAAVGTATVTPASTAEASLVRPPGIGLPTIAAGAIAMFQQSMRGAKYGKLRAPIRCHSLV